MLDKMNDFAAIKHQVKAGKRANKAKMYLARLKAFYRRNKRMPSYGEIAKLLRFKSKYAALYQANKWINAGIIGKDSAGKLLPGKLFQTLKLLGEVRAGWPSPAEEENADTISLDDWLIPNKEASFMLKVSGDSMVDAGIMPGDMVIIDRSRQPQNGDIVVAEVDHEWTIKYLTREGTSTGRIQANNITRATLTGGREDNNKSGLADLEVRAGTDKGERVILKAANKNYPPIIPKEELKIAGVVRAVVRKY
jgi:SOS regulatory protein LexA